MARFQAILTTNGYKTNIGNNTFLFRAAKPEYTEMPCVFVNDVKEVTNPQTAGVHQMDLTIECVCFDAVIDGEPSQAVRDILADLTKAIGVDRFWSGLAYNTDPGDDSITMEHDERVVGIGLLSFVVKYRTASFDPYTQR